MRWARPKAQIPARSTPRNDEAWFGGLGRPAGLQGRREYPWPRSRGNKFTGSAGSAAASSGDRAESVGLAVPDVGLAGIWRPSLGPGPETRRARSFGGAPRKRERRDLAAAPCALCG